MAAPGDRQGLEILGLFAPLVFLVGAFLSFLAATDIAMPKN
jgi:hypothetical protein